MLAAGVVALAGILVLVKWKTGLIEAADTAVLELREAGSEVFFVAMALLPAMGFPLIAFTLTAGLVFGPTLGTGWGIVWSLTAVVVNLLLTYWLANRGPAPACEPAADVL